MPEFSTMLQTPEIRQLTQEKHLERKFHDALFPELLFRSAATPVRWPEGAGDQIIQTGTGLIEPDTEPLAPGVDPIPTSYEKEQWSATKQPYGQTIDEHMPSSVSALASLLLDKSQKMGMAAAQSLNRKTRNELYNAAMSGHTTARGAQNAVTALRVTRLNGFTKARRPDLAQGSPVRFETVSTNNPLAIVVYDSTGPAEVARNVVGFTPDIPGDEVGPGTLTLDAAVTVADRAYVIANDSTALVRVGGGKSVDDVGSADLFTLATIRQAVARFRTMNVPTHADGRYHVHLDPTSQTQIFADSEWQRLLTGVPDYAPFKEFALGQLLGCVFYANNETPQAHTVRGAGTSFATQGYSTKDRIAAEVRNATGVAVHRPIFTGLGGLVEYYEDFDNQVTEAGLQGAKMKTSVSNNGIQVMAERTWLMIRSPQNRMQDMVSLTWKFAGDFPFRTDAATGDGARFKRVLVVEHGA